MALRAERVVERAAELEMPALALTITGNVRCAGLLYKVVKEKGVKQCGVEAYVAAREPQDRTVRTVRSNGSNEPPGEKNRYHLLLLAKKPAGLQEPPQAHHLRGHRRVLLQAARRP